MKTPRVLICAGILAATTLHPATASAQTAVDKLLRGLAGMTCGVMEFPGNIYRETSRSGAEGAPLGFVKGVGMIVVRELAGVWEFVTAPIPVPSGYRPLLDPAYPWGYFEQGGAHHGALRKPPRQPRA